MPSYLQSTTSDCGVCCLGFISNHYGRPHTIAEIRSRYFFSDRGLTFSDLVKISKSLHLNARPVKLGMDAVKNLALPAVLHWNMDHFVVLVKLHKNGATIFDPARGKKFIDFSDISNCFTGFAIEVTPSEEFQKFESGPKLTWRQLTGKIVGLRRSLSQIFVLAASLQLILMLSPLFTQWIVDGAIVSGDVNLLWVLLIGAILSLLIRIGLEAARGWLGILMSAQFGIHWAARVKSHMLGLPVQWFETRHTGDVVSRFRSVETIQKTITGKLVEICLDGLFALITLIVIFFYSPKLAMVVIAAILLYLAIRIIPHAAFHRISDEALTHESKAQSHFLESIRAMSVIKLAGLEEHRNIRWQNLLTQATNKQTLTQLMSVFFSSGYRLTFGLESIVILGWGAKMTIDGQLTVGMLMAFISYKDEFSSRMQRFIDNVMSIRMLSLHVERLSDIVLAEKEVVSGSLPEHLDAAGWLEPSVKLENVSFRYGENCPWILRNISIEIKAGEHVAIIGPTGCGKSTLAKLMLGLLSPTEGQIVVGGLPISQIGLSNWRRHVGAVMQDDQLFSGSMHENISAFDEQIDWDRIHSAAKLAAIHDEITAMPMGYFTLNGDMGSSLSGGQKQRVLLARALYRQPRVMLLDEATSHLDVIREKQVNTAICSLRMTRITIAHRPETIAMAERVIDISKISSTDSTQIFA